MSIVLLINIMIRLTFYHSLDNYDDDYYDHNNRFINESSIYPPDIEIVIKNKNNMLVLYFNQTNTNSNIWYRLLSAITENKSYSLQLTNDNNNHIIFKVTNGFTEFGLISGTNLMIISIENYLAHGIIEKIYQKSICYEKNVKKFEISKY
ncbi:hypothetical protein [Powai lake megavirus]|uniref:Uncharacterized protein n=1 Tax=Powai lake megavirus TaxID=1842663 RepID=A0A167RMF8_9VIRU|nr:hypothetical protein QJ849_gp711 [Powai lake megavirus]ANB50873.1 hypothetical protein [Powai lake megavirus]